MSVKKYTFDFVGKFKLAMGLSGIFILITLVMLNQKGLNYGVDFKGGAELQVKFGETVDLSTFRKTLENAGFPASTVQTIGAENSSEYLVKVAGDEGNLSKISDELSIIFKEQFADKKAEIRKTDIVGPKAGEQLKTSGFQALAWALLIIMVYVGLRFDFKYAPGAIVALLHDVLVVIGVFVLMQKEFNLQIVGALLAIIGYSVNDTVVIYDRVREHEEMGDGRPLSIMINDAINETLSRTFLTLLTTLMVALIMFFMGGAGIHDFFFDICIGLVAGTYSTVYIAAPIVLGFDKLLNSKKGNA